MEGAKALGLVQKVDKRGGRLMDILVVGGGFVGLTTAVVLAERGNGVTVVENDLVRYNELCAGRPPFYEPGLADAMGVVVGSRSLQFLRRVGDAESVDIVILAVGTPQDVDGSADLTCLVDATEEIAALQTKTGKRLIVAVKSTVPPGTTSGVVAQILSASSTSGSSSAVAAVPEFLREGSALQDARKPDRVVIGAEDDATAELLSFIFDAGGPVLKTDPTTAETIKYASNAMLATRIAFANEIANLSECLGIDVDTVMEGVGLDRRIGPSFLRAGPGFGGSCFPKDLHALRYLGRQSGVSLRILDAVLRNNEEQPLRAIDLVRQEIGGLEGKKIALLGLAFKPHTSDVRDTRALPIYNALIEAGALVSCHDPIAGAEFRQLVPNAEIMANLSAALKDADACIIQTEWPEYRELKPMAIIKHMRKPIVIDCRRHLDAQKLQAAGVTIRAMGCGLQERSA